VFYAIPYKANLKLTVNGGETETVLFPSSDAYCYQSGNPTNFPIIKSLNSGNNSLKCFLNKNDAFLEKNITFF